MNLILLQGSCSKYIWDQQICTHEEPVKELKKFISFNSTQQSKYTLPGCQGPGLTLVKAACASKTDKRHLQALQPGLTAK